MLVGSGAQEQLDIYLSGTWSCSDEGRWIAAQCGESPGKKELQGMGSGFVGLHKKGSLFAISKN